MTYSKHIAIPVPKEREIYLYSDVNQTSILGLTKSIHEINNDDGLIAQMCAVNGMNYNPRPIKLYIDSYGGAVYQCLGFLNVMDKSTTPIHTIVTGCACSSGFIIAINGHKRYCYSKSTYMYHQMSVVQMGELQEIENRQIEYQRLQDIVHDHVGNKTGISLSQLKKIKEHKKNQFFNSAEALKLKIVDEII